MNLIPLVKTCPVCMTKDGVEERLGRDDRSPHLDYCGRCGLRAVPNAIDWIWSLVREAAPATFAKICETESSYGEESERSE